MTGRRNSGVNSREKSRGAGLRFLLLISLRNLLRQKRRNLLLGAAMAIGMALLVIAHGFSHGISDVMFNRILTYVTGHLSLAFTVKGNINRQLFPDGERMREIIDRAVPQARRVEEAIGVFSRAVGNGVSDNIILIGIDPRVEATPEEQAELESNFGMVEGDFEDITREDLENPVILAQEKADYLQVKRGDLVRARFQDVYGRNQAVRLTVAGIFKPANIFMTAPVFMDLRRLKVLAGYGPHDIGGLQITLPNPKRNAIPAAESLHAALAPPLAAAYGSLSREGRSLSAAVFGFQVDTASLGGLALALKVHPPKTTVPPGGLASVLRSPPPRAAEARSEEPDGTPGAPVPLASRSILLGKTLADSLRIAPGEVCTLTYTSKHFADPAQAAFEVTHVIPPAPDLPGNLVLVNDRDFYDFYYAAWPAAPPAFVKGAVPASGPGPVAPFRPDSTHRLRPFLNTEWVLLERTSTTTEMQKKYREATRLKTRATLVDVQTMYESASMIVNVEYALNLITLVAVLILFFIIQVGVVNTLRMTIRERTREIGTMRAIGMQRGDVRSQFLLETFFLSAAASAVGVALAFLGMWLLRLKHFEPEGNPLGMLLVDGRLHFVPTLLGVAAYVLLILLIAAITAWFPARRAANLPPTEALSHFG